MMATCLVVGCSDYSEFRDFFGPTNDLADLLDGMSFPSDGGTTADDGTVTADGTDGGNVVDGELVCVEMETGTIGNDGALEDTEFETGSFLLGASGGIHLGARERGMRVAASNDVNNSGVLRVGFQVTATADYQFWLRIHLEDHDGDIENSDSFWFEVDNDGNWRGCNGLFTVFDGGVNGNWVWLRVVDTDSGTSGTLETGIDFVRTLVAGQHSVGIQVRENGVKFDQLVITSNAGFVPPTGPCDVANPGPQNVCVEVESGTIANPGGIEPGLMLASESLVPGFSGAAYVGSTEFGTNVEASDSDTTGVVSLSALTSQQGPYQMWARYRPHDSDGSFANDDGFYFRNGTTGRWLVWDSILQDPNSSQTDWFWTPVKNSNATWAGVPVHTFPWSAGTHTVQIKFEENGAYLDQVLFTNDLAYTPTAPCVP